MTPEEARSPTKPRKSRIFTEKDFSAELAEMGGKKKTYTSVLESTWEERKARIDRKMLYLVYQYTRPHYTKDEMSRAVSQTIDYSGTDHLRKKSSDSRRDFFDEGVMRAQDIKLANIKRKLNQSVDLANFKQKTMEREKQKYHNHPVYKNITAALTFDN